MGNLTTFDSACLCLLLVCDFLYGLIRIFVSLLVRFFILSLVQFTFFRKSFPFLIQWSVTEELIPVRKWMRTKSGFQFVTGAFWLLCYGQKFNMFFSARQQYESKHLNNFRTKTNSNRSKCSSIFSISKGKSFNFLRRNIYFKVSKLISNNNWLYMNCQANAVQYYHDKWSRLFSIEIVWRARDVCHLCMCHTQAPTLTHSLTQMNNENQTNKSFILRKWVWKRDKCPTFSTENWKW